MGGDSKKLNRETACCSFCGKRYSDSVPLVEGRDAVLICYLCAANAKCLIAEECFKRGSTPLAQLLSGI
jgi:hypothetical protein